MKFSVGKTVGEKFSIFLKSLQGESEKTFHLYFGERENWLDVDRTVGKPQINEQKC